MDHDRDGFVDLFNQIGYWEGVGPYNDELYRNLGDGTFRKLTFEECGLGDDEAEGVLHAWCDYDNDGWPDVYLAGYRNGDPSSMI